MISKNDILLLLTELQNSGVDCHKEFDLTLKSQDIPLEALKKINDNRPIDIVKFYDKLRRSYNEKHSKLYISIMKSDENKLNDPRKILTTLSALLNQILQYDAEDKVLFYKHSRCNEIIKVLEIYFNNYNLDPASQLLALMKADIISLEYIDGRRIFN